MIVQFIDDTSLSIRMEQQSVVSTISTLSLFSQASRLIINEEKSAAYGGTRRNAIGRCGPWPSCDSGLIWRKYPNF